MNNQFVFDSKLKTTLFGLMGVGLLCLILAFFMDDQPHHARFWSNFLHNSVFFTGIALMGLFALSAFITAWAGWYTVIKRILEAYAQFLGVGIILMGIVTIGIWGHFHHLYHWADAEAVASDEILEGKSGFLNKGWYTFGSMGFLVVWYLFARWLRKASLDEDEGGSAHDYSFHKRQRFLSALFLPFAGFTACAVVWLWVMSVDAHWYSTLFAWYNMASWFVSFIAITILTVLFLKSRGYLTNVTDEHLHDLGKYMFAFSVFWTYLWFSQYMLIWYANVGEETIYFFHRRENYPVLFYGNLIINFLVPFFVLMRNDTKRKFGTLFVIAIVVLFGHWWDFFQMLKPGILITAQESAAHGAEAGGHGHAAGGFVEGFTIPGLLELGTFIGFLALFFYVGFHYLSKAALQPKHDPYMGESLHHHV
ncbi:MAG: hypothetical protein R2879_21020 [Saprospiraceae bacterium]